MSIVPLVISGVTYIATSVATKYFITKSSEAIKACFPIETLEKASPEFAIYFKHAELVGTAFSFIATTTISLSIASPVYNSLNAIENLISNEAGTIANMALHAGAQYLGLNTIVAANIKNILTTLEDTVYVLPYFVAPNLLDDMVLNYNFLNNFLNPVSANLVNDMAAIASLVTDPTCIFSLGAVFDAMQML